MVEDVQGVTHLDNPSSEVIILGAGISGMLAAWACEQRGRSFTIVDRGPLEILPRLVRGCVYLHEPCGLNEVIRSQILHTSVLPYPGAESAWWSRIYHHKIWGERAYEPNSIDKYVGEAVIWSMNDALAYLYSCYRDYVDIREVDWIQVRAWLDLGRKVISTIPLGALFPSIPRIGQSLWIWQAAMPGEQGSFAYTTYNVDPDVAWYRMSTMFGHLSVEFCQEPEGLSAARFKKIVSVDMRDLDRLHPHLLFTGRWARWQRGFLSHMAYEAVCQKFDSGEWR